MDGGFTLPHVKVKQPAQPDFRTEFWREAPDMRPTRGRDKMATAYVCRYIEGRHEVPIQPWCPHYKAEDETGFRINPSWTVQWDRVGEDGEILEG